mmetsp:Transcript_24110/g.50576  ORF Transcript_24110/g.50576 Transcript_24110/m.50576 type:complete len:258 (+) Transcript_24110:322-1095(+)
MVSTCERVRRSSWSCRKRHPFWSCASSSNAPCAAASSTVRTSLPRSIRRLGWRGSSAAGLPLLPPPPPSLQPSMLMTPTATPARSTSTISATTSTATPPPRQSRPTKEENAVRQTENHILLLDMDAVIVLVFGQDTIAFEMKGQHWWTPTLGGLEVKNMRICARLRVWWNLLHSRLKIAFLAEPKVEWDVELKVLGIDLPDLLEDKLLPWVVQKYLKRITIEDPITIDVNLRDYELMDAHEEAKAAEEDSGRWSDNS